MSAVPNYLGQDRLLARKGGVSRSGSALSLELLPPAASSHALRAAPKGSSSSGAAFLGDVSRRQVGVGAEWGQHPQGSILLNHPPSPTTPRAHAWLLAPPCLHTLLVCR